MPVARRHLWTAGSAPALQLNYRSAHRGSTLGAAFQRGGCAWHWECRARRGTACNVNPRPVAGCLQWSGGGKSTPTWSQRPPWPDCGLTAVYSAVAGSLGRAGGPRSSATIGLDTIPSQSVRLVIRSARNTGRRAAIYATCMRCVPRAACEVSQLAPRGDEMPRLGRVAARATGSTVRPRVRGVSSMRSQMRAACTGCGVANVYLHGGARSRSEVTCIWRHWAAPLPDREFWPRDGGRETAPRSRSAPARGCAGGAWVVPRACAGWW